MRPEWGVGLWVQEERSRRRFRFKDGKLRVFKKGFYHLLKPVDVQKVDVDSVFEEIAGQHDLLALEEIKATARLESPPVMTLLEQINFFKSQYPGGFTGDAYRDAYRTPIGSSRPKKAHIDISRDLARIHLNKKALGESIAAEDFDAIHEAAVKILSKTSLVSLSKAVRPVKALEGDAKEAFCRALNVLLHGEERYQKRFGNWLHTLRVDCGLKVSWTFTTLFPALVHPKRHVCAKSKAFDLQARTVRPGTAILNHPTPTGYRRIQQVAKSVHQALTEAGLKPQDNLDIRHFVWDTLRPKAQGLVAERRKRR